jgi:hypothetical protein
MLSIEVMNAIWRIAAGANISKRRFRMARVKSHKDVPSGTES